MGMIQSLPSLLPWLLLSIVSLAMIYRKTKSTDDRSDLKEGVLTCCESNQFAVFFHHYASIGNLNHAVVVGTYFQLCSKSSCAL